MIKALYFGSFNPLHIGHMAIANYVLEFAGADRLVFVVTPASRFKAGDTELLEANAAERLVALKSAVCGSGLDIEVSDIEFSMPSPYYTVNTVEEFVKREPDTEFVIVMGADNLSLFNKWYRYEDIMSMVGIWVYPRLGYDLHTISERYGDVVRILDAPIIEVSSTMIREAEAAGRNMSAFRYRGNH